MRDIVSHKAGGEKTGNFAMVPTQNDKSATVFSNQGSPHPGLQTLVERHLLSASLKPVAQHNHAVFSRVKMQVERLRLPLILDAGCGNGASSIRLAQTHPGYCVIGVDKSAHRLQSALQRKLPENCLIVRAELHDFWHLAFSHGWQLAKHYLLYPNPWPKRQHLQRRWHGSSAFPFLLALGGQLELRTNWHIYALEFRAALSYAGHDCAVARLSGEEPLTPFEAKYQASGHTLWRCNAEIPICRRGD